MTLTGRKTASTVVDIGNCSGDEVDKFEKFGLSPLPAQDVGPPLIGECLANIECRIADDSMVETYNLFLLEALRIWIDPTGRSGGHYTTGETGPSR
jgi:flavin reductase (DIM6/NTAB) family NADH-FMN oxidoreductase RutF